MGIRTQRYNSIIYVIGCVSGTFWLYFGVCFLGLLFILAMLPETKNKTLEQVQELFMSAEYKAQYLESKPSNPPMDTRF